MAEQANLREMANIILNIRQEVDKLKTLGGGYKCVEMNIVRMSAMIKMLELDINDAADVLGA
ncbi:MAG: hypothetical protein A4E52_00960 [Pelotomaculum sp. PtaB.Bin013]|uniref:Uncharacterized protein n=1 Tax=Pelotomaculum isophthalicicum JI TaxID=947010 RepID=A0A9X4H0L4_9FIRM|nr:hypothetical protein [Pelotomaculum isophthalicicum]MDF9406841.1 hypothetical protein [Pelotomaculum isophthalicicum JI]OPX89661.1 MAG: hypothetical protein A4E52_00960 [Pelotomaculum sp. PtaB.Bin013]